MYQFSKIVVIIIYHKHQNEKTEKPNHVQYGRNLKYIAELIKEKISKEKAFMRK